MSFSEADRFEPAMIPVTAGKKSPNNALKEKIEHCQLVCIDYRLINMNKSHYYVTNWKVSKGKCQKQRRPYLKSQYIDPFGSGTPALFVGWYSELQFSASVTILNPVIPSGRKYINKSSMQKDNTKQNNNQRTTYLEHRALVQWRRQYKCTVLRRGLVLRKQVQPC